jgi:hypothetical protein
MKAAGPVEEHKRKISSDPDGSNMMIKTAGPATIPPGGKVKCVHETKAEFKIDFEDGSSATLCLADPARPLSSEIRIMQWNTSERSDDYPDLLGGLSRIER